MEQSTALALDQSDKHLLLIDLSSIWHACWHATADKELSAAFHQTVDSVHGFISRFRPTHVAVCCDSPPYTHRKSLLPQYKAQRDAPPPGMVEQFRRVKERLACDGLLLWASEGFEADDVIATAVASASGFDSVVIVSSDKDLLQLVDDERAVRVHSPSAATTYDKTGVIAKLGVAPDMVGDFLALQGDASDNVPGIRGVGKVTAAKLLLQWGSLHEVLANADRNTPKLTQSLIEGGQGALVARQVVELRRDVPLRIEELYEERKPQQLTKDSVPMEDEETGEIVEDEELSPMKPPSQPSNIAPAPAPARRSDPPPPPVAHATTSIVVSPAASPAEWNLQLEPNSLGLARKLACDLLNSRLFSKFPSEEAIFAVIIRGREMGLGALTSLDVMTFFEGKVSISAHFIISKAKEHPDCAYFQCLETTDQFSEWETQNRRNKKPTKLRYTIEQARQAGLCRPPAAGKQEGNWIRRPSEMLRKTAGVQLARLEYPSAALGLYCPEEMGTD